MAGTIEQAILALYSPTGIGRAEANEYLLRVSEQDEAWGACLELLCAANKAEEVRYFAANMLYQKVSGSWGPRPPNPD